jgi:N-acyl amino acid synthase of PEP-CTERM/exosortase system
MQAGAEIAYDLLGSTRKILDKFDIKICNTISDIKKCMKIRYDVYCLEKGWESADAFPDRLERDGFDETAVHVLLKDRARGQAVGAARIIYPDPDISEGRLPAVALSRPLEAALAQYCGLDGVFEVSRLTISRDALASGSRGFDAALPNASPALALLKGVLQATAYDEFNTACMTVAPPMKRMLTALGCRLHDIGVRIEHRGVRVPLFRNLHAMLAEMHEVRPDVWRYLTDGGETWPLDRAALVHERIPALQAMAQV